VNDTARDIAAGALRDARNQGCTCEPWITTEQLSPGWWKVEVAHDSDCPRLRPLHARDN
jgi:hypothetical protein